MGMLGPEPWIEVLVSADDDPENGAYFTGLPGKWGYFVTW